MSQSFRTHRAALALRYPKLWHFITEDDIKHLFTTFERIAHVCHWTKKHLVRLVTLLTGKACSAHFLMDIKDSEK